MKKLIRAIWEKIKSWLSKEDLDWERFEELESKKYVGKGRDKNDYN